MSTLSRWRAGPARGVGCRGPLPYCDPGQDAPSGAPKRSAFRTAARQSAEPSVLVVFADHAGCPWLRLLRRGFRHCFVMLRAGPLWLACEPLKDRIELDVLDLPRDFDLARFYGEQGHRVLLGGRPPPGPRRRFALAPLTCVTVVKRLLGIDAPWVWTPSQLYAHLSSPPCGFRPWYESRVTAELRGSQSGGRGDKFSP